MFFILMIREVDIFQDFNFFNFPFLFLTINMKIPQSIEPASTCGHSRTKEYYQVISGKDMTAIKKSDFKNRL